MATLRGPQLARRGVAVALVASALSACNGWSLPGTSNTLKKLYIKDYTLSVGARLIAGTSSQEFEDTKSANVRSLGNIGLVYSPNYIFVADPELLIAASQPIDLPTDQLVKETAGYDVDGKPITESVLRAPLYILDKVTLSYSVPGFTIPNVTITEDIPIKSNEYQLHLNGVAQVNELMAAFAQDPAKVGSVAGNVTITLDLEDLDPVATAKTFTVARTFPLVYSYLPFTPETDISPPPSFGFPSPEVTDTPTPAPSPSPSPTPTASASTGLF